MGIRFVFKLEEDVRKWSVGFKQAKAKKGTIELRKAIFTHLLLIGVPTLLFYYLRLGESDLTDLHLAIAAFYSFSALVMLLETAIAMFRRFAAEPDKMQGKDEPGPGRLNQLHASAKAALSLAGAQYPTPTRPLPRCSFLIAAYLPNEQDIIIETIERILLNTQRPSDGLEVILAYNTPMDLPIEADLRRLAQHYPELKLLRVEGSRSKAENLNAGFDLVTGEVTCILDADHHPAADCFVRAWHWIAQGYDVVQGRSIIRNHDQNLLTKLIAIEFEIIYGIVHPTKSFLTDSSIFGGSNGYWRTSVLKKICFNPLMLTEDIDASMRTLLRGYQILHDRSILSTELAPVDLHAFWFQRKRWAQGWFEVGLKYQRQLWISDKLSRWQKTFWTYLLCYCAFFPIVALQIIPLGLSLSLQQQEMPVEIDQALWFSTVLFYISVLCQAIVTAKIAAVRYPSSYYLKHILLLFPYIVFKNVIAIVGAYDFLRGNSPWVVTSRGTPDRYRSMLQPEAGVVLEGESQLAITPPGGLLSPYADPLVEPDRD
jgi:cellulose synthase/poly-beta-1,6-N-acetylglucosamine synthase-like glycosyltransferase